MRLMGLAPGPGELRVARAERRLGTTRLVALERHPVPDAAALDDVLARLAAARPHVVRTALPLALATHRILVLPFTTRRRLARTAPLELLGQLPADVEDPRVACVPLGPAPGGLDRIKSVRGAGYLYTRPSFDG